MIEVKSFVESSLPDQSESSFNPQNALTWPEGTPAVSMSVNLHLKTGFRGSFVIGAYKAFLDNNVWRHNHSDLLVHIDTPVRRTAGSYKSPPDEEGSVVYRPEKLIGQPLAGICKMPIAVIRIHMAKKEYRNGYLKYGIDRARSANETLVHETGHYKADLIDIPIDQDESYALGFELQHRSYDHKFIIEDKIRASEKT